MLAEVYGWFPVGFDIAYVQEATAFLEALQSGSVESQTV